MNDKKKNRKLNYNIIVKNGKKRKRLLYIKREKGQIYFGHTTPENIGKWTIHDNRFHFRRKINNEVIREEEIIYKGHQSLKNFKGFDCFAVIDLDFNEVFISNLHEVEDNKRYNGIVEIDSRNYIYGTAINLYLVEENKFGILTEHNFNFSGNQIYIFAEENPWLVIEIG